MDRQALFEKFLSVLQSEPLLPEYLGEEPISVPPFDPYQMVAEWVALRHEVKQQGKLLQSTQNTLQKALEMVEVEQEDLQQSLEVSHQGVVQADQKALWRDLLGVVDALDQACNHWQEQIDELTQSQQMSPAQPRSRWQQWIHQLLNPEQDELLSAHPSSPLREVLVSNQEGVDLIRRSLLDVLRQRQVIPIAAKGYPFDPQIMYAIGRQEDATVPENTVLQEIVRGYRWGDQILREAQVIVAVKKD
jgi:molecular chaperone GrpE